MTVPPTRRTPGTRVLVQRGRWTTRTGTLTTARPVELTEGVMLNVELNPTRKSVWIAADDLTPFCPDDGACHHECPPASCFRVRYCAPLSGVYPDDEWPADVTAEHAEPAP